VSPLPPHHRKRRPWAREEIALHPLAPEAPERVALLRALDALRDASRSSERPAAVDSSPRGSETILLVEDADQVRVLARNILKRSGYQVLDAADGEEALHLCERFSGTIHLVVTDVVMPKMSGRQLMERLSAARPDTKVLFMSGYTDDIGVRHGVVDEGIAFLQKPFTPQTLTRKVREVLDAASRSA